MHFEATVQLRIPLRGAEWKGVKPEAFHVKVSERELIAKCTSFYVMEELGLRFSHDVDPEGCWCSLERELGEGGARSKVLLVELAKRTPGEAWSRKFLSASPARSAEELRILFEVEQKGWPAVPLKPRRDEDDRFVTDREKLCRELEVGQTEESIQLRLLLNADAWKEATGQVPHYRLWGLDISRRYVKLFVRGDPASPVLLGKLAGNCAPDRCYHQLSTVQVSEAGSVEEVPCLYILIVKADDAYFDWGQEPIDYNVSEDVLEDAQPGDGGDSGNLDLAGCSPGEWIQEMRDRAAIAFKAGEYNDAIEYYTRLLQCTPGSEKLLSNRSVAYLKAEKFEHSLEDALKAQEIRPDFAKVYFRKGQALQALHRLKEAIAAFREGMAIDGGDNPEWNREIIRTKHMQRDVREKRGTWV